MSAVAEIEAHRTSGQSTFVSEVLHKLSQPLTALQCSLELSLVRDRTAEEFRASVEAALQNAERLRQNLLLLRELSDADDPGDVSTPVQLHTLLQELQQDFLPVCESSGGHFTVNCDSVQIRGNGAKLRRAFFYLLEYLLCSSRRRGLDVTVQQVSGRPVEIRISFSGKRFGAVPTSDTTDSTATGEVEIAGRTFRAVGGNLVMNGPADAPTGCVASVLSAE